MLKDYETMTYNETDIEVIPEDWGTKNSIIKVIGVGGGGCNAVNYMYNKRIEGCTFIVCNTDKQSLDKSPVPIKIQLGSGLGAGCNPTEGRIAAQNAQDVIAEKILNTKTDMLFITAGMGGGTGTGAAPVIAALAKGKGILTVGVVTIPFKNEGNESLSKAIDGIYELQKNVDSLLIINNEKIYTHYGSLLVHDAFPKTDEVLATAVQGITEIINKPGYVNVDFKDVKAMMTGSGMALMGCGTGKGKNRIKEAVTNALSSPLLNDFDIKTAKNVLINITSGYNEKGLLMDDLAEIDRLLTEQFGEKANRFKRGIVYETAEDFGDQVSITVIATGFEMQRLNEITDVKVGNIIMIDSDFKYSREVMLNSSEVDLPETSSHKIGFNSSSIKNTFLYNKEGKPALLLGEKDSKRELETIAAIRRKVQK
jgi:cell division protein FtsZ